jgi:hypothetical protein
MGLLLLIEVFIQKNLRFGIFKAQVFYVECVNRGQLQFIALFKVTSFE